MRCLLGCYATSPEPIKSPDNTVPLALGNASLVFTFHDAAKEIVIKALLWPVVTSADRMQSNLARGLRCCCGSNLAFLTCSFFAYSGSWSLDGEVSHFSQGGCFLVLADRGALWKLWYYSSTPLSPHQDTDSGNEGTHTMDEPFVFLDWGRKIWVCGW